MFRQIGPTEILLILGVVLLLFGGRKLPELARGSGRALRIFKSEVQELQGDEKDERDQTLTADADEPAARSTTTAPATEQASSDRSATER